MAVKRVEGVEDAKFSYSGAEGWVTFDITMTSPEEFLGELSRLTAFSGTVREFVSAETIPADDELEDESAEQAEDDPDHSDPDHEHSGDEGNN